MTNEFTAFFPKENISLRSNMYIHSAVNASWKCYSIVDYGKGAYDIKYIYNKFFREIELLYSNYKLSSLKRIVNLFSCDS